MPCIQMTAAGSWGSPAGFCLSQGKGFKPGAECRVPPRQNVLAARRKEERGKTEQLLQTPPETLQQQRESQMFKHQGAPSCKFTMALTPPQALQGYL